MRKHAFMFLINFLLMKLIKLFRLSLSIISLGMVLVLTYKMPTLYAGMVSTLLFLGLEILPKEIDRIILKDAKAFVFNLTESNIKELSPEIQESIKEVRERFKEEE